VASRAGSTGERRGVAPNAAALLVREGHKERDTGTATQGLRLETDTAYTAHRTHTHTHTSTQVRA
jgi:hypothetical protein